LFDIFYNREIEIEFLSCLIDEEKTMLEKSRTEYKAWIEEAKRLFHEFGSWVNATENHCQNQLQE
jgi:hypothetical protein